mmetsp:Transcript_74023/g.123613  ORF Transcript_74023/g.123613 Transcript_74023/m.123613 type:complete len:109 (+) Transcript_74023:28-354(+)
MPGPKKWSGGKRRLKRPRTVEAKASLEQRVTKHIHKSKTHAQQEPMHKKTPKLGMHEKRLRALNKKLQSLEALQERVGRGETLDEQQQTKLGTLGMVLQEMEVLMTVG